MTVQTVIGYIILGLIVGAVAKLLLPGKDPGGIIVTILVGIAGSLLGGYVGSNFLGLNTGGDLLDWHTWVTALVGAIVLLIILRALFGRRRRVRR